jgi:hypothetical protein
MLNIVRCALWDAPQQAAPRPLAWCYVSMVRPEFPRHFPALKNTAARTPLLALDRYECVAASGCRTL